MAASSSHVKEPGIPVAAAEVAVAPAPGVGILKGVTLERERIAGAKLCCRLSLVGSIFLDVSLDRSCTTVTNMISQQSVTLPGPNWQIICDESDALNEPAVLADIDATDGEVLEARDVDEVLDLVCHTEVDSYEEIWLRRYAWQCPMGIVNRPFGAPQNGLPPGADWSYYSDGRV